MPAPGSKVCVIGTGPFGLTAIKNMAEQGLDVTGFEKHQYVGGLWHPTESKDQTMVLDITTKNTSKQVSSFTDFPYPADAATHPTAKQVNSYLNSYAQHFGILPRIEFSTEVVKVVRDEPKRKWIVHTKKSGREVTEPREFDRVIIASGQLNVPKIVKIVGAEQFTGDILHSQQFRDPYKYTGKRVIVMGSGATGADTQSFLKKAKAKQIYLSHRSQPLLLPRMQGGKPFDHANSRRMISMLRPLGDRFPNVVLGLMNMMLSSTCKKAFPNIAKNPSFNAPTTFKGLPHTIPMFSEDMAANIESGIVKTVPGIARVSGPREVTLLDGTVLEDIDAIIMCTGYKYDFSMVPGAGNPTDPARAPDGYARMRAAKHYNPEIPFPRLYRGVMSEQYPESLAFFGHMIIMHPPFSMYDLVGMAIARLWTDGYPMPGPEARAKDIDRQYDFVVRVMGRGPVPYTGFRMAGGEETYRWLNEVAGTGINEYIGNFGWLCCKFWWGDRNWYCLLQDGIDTPFIYRLIDTGKGGRKPWKGARAAIEAANEQGKAMEAEWKKKQSAKGK